MSRRSIRIKKEARALFWPWAAVMIAGALPLAVPYHFAKTLNALSFFFGVPLLATLSLGNEFHHRTVSLWLTQPVSRMQLWREKMGVMFAAAVSAGLVSGIVMFSITFPRLDFAHAYEVAALAYVAITLGSATYWTVAARSTLGGFAVMSFIFYAFYLFVAAIESMPGRAAGSKAIPSPATAIIAISAFGIGFAGLMLRIGARKLAQLEVAGGSGGEDLLTAGPRMMPEALAGWLRCQPSGALLNLVRKELRLLRPVWVVGLLIVPYLACLAAFRLLPVSPELTPGTVLEWALLGPPAALAMGMAGLAGILSLGEERRSGTQAWHMTLPISARRQWLVKLAVAMFSGLACAVLLPVAAMMAGGSLWGSPLMFVDLEMLPNWLILYPILTFTCFWCACAADGTVRAATWAFPVLAGIFLASSEGVRLGQEVARNTGTLKDFVVSALHLSPLAFATIADLARTRVLWLFVPTLLFGLIQSYRLFRRQPADGVAWMLRCALPLVVVTILWSFSASAGLVASKWEPFDETRRALDRFQPGTERLVVSGEDLAQGSALTATTRRWLKGSSIAVAPGRSSLSGYVATIQLASGLECRLTVGHSGGTAASCGK